MTSAGRPRKPDATRQGRAPLAIVPPSAPAERFVIPRPPLTNGGQPLLPEVLLRWDAYWDSMLPSALDGVGGIDRLVVDDWARLESELLTLEQVIQSGAAWLVQGSEGQPRLNPLLSERHAIRGRLHDLRQQLGIGPRARAQLGIDVAGAVSAMDRMNEAIDRGARGGHGDEDDADVYDEAGPRVTRTVKSNAQRQAALRARRREAKGQP